MRRAVLMILAALLIGASACGPSTIAGTEVEDTEANREVWDLLQRYRRSVEERDVAELRKMISREYFENAATTDQTADDYGYEKLIEDVLPILKDNVKKVKYDLRITDINVGESRAHATFEYFARFLYTEGGKDGWIAVNDFNRLEFVREDGLWKIASGL